LKVIVWIKKLLKFELAVIDHDCRYLYSQSSIFKKNYNQLIKTQIDKFILIGDSTLKSYVDNGFAVAEALVESPFLPPDSAEEQIILEKYPVELFEFLRNHSPNIVINAYQLSFVGNRDLYGIDSGIYLLESCVTKFPKCGLIVVLAKIGNMDYLLKLQSLLLEKQLKDNVYFLLNSHELWPLLKKVDLFVRPTVSDSYGISIAEAIHFGIPAVASDVCKRPKGTILYDVADRDLLVKQCNLLLEMLR
jgi:glycosyltransferase involved in cell wall biosynthesis